MHIFYFQTYVTWGHSFLLRAPWRETCASPNTHRIQSSSFAQSCPTLCDPMNCSTPGLPVHTNSQSLLKLMSIKSVMPSNRLIL